MKLNKQVIGGAIITLMAVYYWLALWGEPFENIPAGAYGKLVSHLLFAFTFQMFPFANLLWTVAGLSLLYKGIEAARS